MNEDPRAYWNEQAGHRWIRVQEALDGWLGPITNHLLDAVDVEPGQRVIDVGCGGGTTTLALAQRTGPTGHVLGIDVSRPMVEHARERSTGVDQVEYVLADAAEYAFEPESIDRVASRFGVMFFVDPVRAFTNLRRSLRPDGRLIAACWRAPELNPWLGYPMRALPELTPSVPAPDAGPGPFSLSAESRTRKILEAAGFRQVELVPLSVPLCPGPTVDAAITMFEQVGPLSRALSEAADDDRAEMLARVRAFLQHEYRDGPPSTDSATWLVHARA